MFTTELSNQRNRFRNIALWKTVRSILERESYKKRIVEPPKRSISFSLKNTYFYLFQVVLFFSFVCLVLVTVYDTWFYIIIVSETAQPHRHNYCRFWIKISQCCHSGVEYRGSAQWNKRSLTKQNKNDMNKKNESFKATELV